jgi:hypothetical protein
MGIKIQKPIIKSIFSKKVKFRLVIEFDTMIKCTKIPKL